MFPWCMWFWNLERWGQCFCISGLIFEMDAPLFLKNYCFIATEESVAHVWCGCVLICCTQTITCRTLLLFYFLNCQCCLIKRWWLCNMHFDLFICWFFARWIWWETLALFHSLFCTPDMFTFSISQGKQIRNDLSECIWLIQDKNAAKHWWTIQCSSSLSLSFSDLG